MKRAILFMVVILSVNLVFAFDSQIYQSCGGDNELIIGCSGDEELFFMGQRISEANLLGGYSGSNPAFVNETIEPKKALTETDGAFLGFFILILLVTVPLGLLYFIFKKKSKKDKTPQQRLDSFNLSRIVQSNQ